MNQDDSAFDIQMPPDPIEEAIKQMIEVQQQTTAQLQQAMQAMQQMQGQIGQMLSQAMQQVAQSNQQIAASLQSLSAPRRRIPIRDAEGRITEAHDVPMSMQ